MLGREIFTPDEVRKLDNKKCIIFIRGFDPILDNKYIPFAHPMFNQTADGKGEPYVHMIKADSNLIGSPFEILSERAVEHYKKLQKKGENIYIDSLTYEEFMLLGDMELSRRFSKLEEKSEKDKLYRMQDYELEYAEESQKADDNGGNGNTSGNAKKHSGSEKPKWEDSITNRMLHWSYTPEQKEEVKRAIASGIPKAIILSYFYPDVSVEQMRAYRNKQ